MTFSEQELQRINRVLQVNKKAKYYFCKCKLSDLKLVIKVLRFFKTRYKKLGLKIQKKIRPVLKVVKKLCSKSTSMKSRREILANVKICKLMSPLLKKTLLPYIQKTAQ